MPRRRIRSTQIPFEILSGHESSCVCAREGPKWQGRTVEIVQNIPLYSTKTADAISFLSKEQKLSDSNAQVMIAIARAIMKTMTMNCVNERELYMQHLEQVLSPTSRNYKQPCLSCVLFKRLELINRQNFNMVK